MVAGKVSSVVQEKLMPGEVVIGQVRSNIADLVATDKRILKFSSGSHEALDYTDIAGIGYGTFKSRKIASRIFIVLCAIILIAIAVVIWAAYFDETVRNIKLWNAVVISIVCGAFALLSLTAVFTYDYGYYQIESHKIAKNAEKYWKIMRPMFGAKKIDEFFQAVSQQAGKPIDRKKK